MSDPSSTDLPTDADLSTDLFEVVHRQRACRDFRRAPVDDGAVEAVLRAATFAPSAENRQPWVFVVVRDAEVRRAISDLAREVWENGGRSHSEGRLDPGLLAEVDASATGRLGAAPVQVVVGGDTELTSDASLAASVFPAVQTMLLAATALGLGSALTTLPVMAGGKLAELVGLPDHVRALAVVPLGWPGRRLGPPRRLPLAARAHRERFGKGW